MVGAFRAFIHDRSGRDPGETRPSGGEVRPGKSAKAGFYGVASQEEGYPSAKTAVDAIAKAWPQLYLFDPTPIHEALWRISANCIAVKLRPETGRYTWVPFDRNTELQYARTAGLVRKVLSQGQPRAENTKIASVK